MQRRRIRVSGIVQGVGFRPFVYREATRLGLRGWVRNDDRGVLIEAQGDAAALDALTAVLVADPPPLARVRDVRAETIPAGDDAEFAIVASTRGPAPAVPVAPDSATCDACLAEVDDPANRRYRYPFTNCTNCGPRYTIVRRVPYDRPNTTMAGFVMCAACQAEYDDPADRRFHAQPNACAACGPQLRFGDRMGDAALRATVDALHSGGIVAVKGLGGFHLACDAASDAAVDELRRRKHRDDKPFAVMATADQADALCEWTDASRAALHSPRRPIVLAPRRAGATIAAGVAPGLPDLGVLLAYTPLHHLLLAGVGRPLVMTSGNVSDEPIAHDDADAAARLGPLVDGVLGHDRPIHIRADDSVVRDATPSTNRYADSALQGHYPHTDSVTGTGTGTVLRRSRGYAPEPIPLHAHAPRTILALGGELKNTVAVTVGDYVVVSHHIGDLEHLANHTAFRQAIDHLCALYDVAPAVVAHDLHPEYLSTKFAHDLALPLVGVQHHHAHVAACLVDNACDG
ncbi:MAG TPA: carbamoyltransferase HypF, partial [Acidimicrobiales bacterium]|nr:carbamoyltransferase HypF [Acidimicrobiales bacterium]